MAIATPLSIVGGIGNAQSDIDDGVHESGVAQSVIEVDGDVVAADRHPQRFASAGADLVEQAQGIVAGIGGGAHDVTACGGVERPSARRRGGVQADPRPRAARGQCREAIGRVGHRGRGHRTEHQGRSATAVVPVDRRRADGRAVGVGTWSAHENQKDFTKAYLSEARRLPATRLAVTATTVPMAIYPDPRVGDVQFIFRSPSVRGPSIGGP